MENFGYGAIPDRFDSRDYQFEEVAGSAPFDWSTTFDIEEKIGRKLPIKNQNGSSSCGGQAWSYYAEVLEALDDATFEERSAKFIYAQTAVPGGGSRGRDNCEIVVKQGVCKESTLSSYENGNPPSEAFMARPQDITAEIRDEASQDKALIYASVNCDIDTFAQAIRDNNGLVIGISGENNNTWHTAFPKPPQTVVWRHWMYVGKVKIIDGKKYIGAINSWGNVGENGWQWFGEDYFKNSNIWQGWTMVFQNSSAIQKPKYLFTETLRFGSKGKEVTALQECLKYLGYFGVTPTGYFGNITKEAVKKYQARWKLVVDGVVGPKTRLKLNGDFN